MNRKERRAAAKTDAGFSAGRTVSATRLLAQAADYYAADRLDAAANALKRAMRADPASAEIPSNLAVVLERLGRLPEALKASHRAVALAPDQSTAYYNLGVGLTSLGCRDGAAIAYRRVLTLNPGDPEAHSNLGAILVEQGHLLEAIAHCRQAIALDDKMASAYANLGGALRQKGSIAAAIAASKKALALDPTLAKAHADLGAALIMRGDGAEAIAQCREALAIDANQREARLYLAVALGLENRLGAATAVCEQLLAVHPDDAVAYNNLADLLVKQGRLAEAIVHCRRALVLDPAFLLARQNLLMELQYRPDVDQKTLFDESRRYAEAVPCQTPRRTARRPVAGRGKLRVGYVSPDFRRHAVASFLEPLLAHHDHAAFEIFGYAEVSDPDGITERLRGYADHWRSTVGLGDDEMADQIDRDGIDILVDLAGHTRGNRLGVFARLPAPVQVTWLGYPNTTGLATIDYRLVDALTDPPGDAGEVWHSERLWRLDGGFLCFRPPDDAPEPEALDRTEAGIIFGSFNNPTKLSDPTLDAWASILARVPGARLRLKGLVLADEQARACLRRRLDLRGIDAGRVDLLEPLAKASDHLAAYHRIDIALDPFPYNGTTTTCEALWMGVPVLTLRGDRHAGRVGASLLTQTGLTDWIAGDAEAYVRMAVTAAADRERLGLLRRSLRHRVAGSPLCDAPAFVLKIEAAFKKMALLQ